MALDLNRIKTYFKDKIDWKFFEYLVYKITPLLDNGKLVSISICSDFDRFIIYDNEFGFMIDETPNRQEYIKSEYIKSFKFLDNKTLEEYFEMKGFYYQIYATKEFTHLGAPATSDDVDTLNKIWEAIKEKCIDQRDEFDHTGMHCLYFSKK